MRSFSYALLFLLISKTTNAQHCPYDGFHLIAINVVDNHGHAITDTTLHFFLQEIDNPMADSCSHAKGFIRKQFLTNAGFTALTDLRVNNGYNNQLTKRLLSAGIFANANRMININQTENTCILTGESKTAYTNYIYRQRKFAIVYTIDGKEITKILPPDRIYPLCTARKEVDSFKPLTIQLD